MYLIEMYQFFLVDAVSLRTSMLSRRGRVLSERVYFRVRQEHTTLVEGLAGTAEARDAKPN